jgi:hypothetical protein
MLFRFPRGCYRYALAIRGRGASANIALAIIF